MATLNSFSIEVKEDVKKLAAEYVMLRMSVWYCKKMEILTIKDFNTTNTIGLTKFLLYPFFTCIANGSFNSLYDLFHPFYAMEDGPISSVALKLITTSDSFKYFEIETKNSYSLMVKDEENYIVWEDLESTITKTSFTTVDGLTCTFSDIAYDEEPDKTIVKSIISSIEAIQKQTDDKFIIYNDFQVVTLARQHRSWSTVYNYYSNIPNSKLSDFEIQKEEAKKDRKVFKPLEELSNQ